MSEKYDKNKSEKDPLQLLSLIIYIFMSLLILVFAAAMLQNDFSTDPEDWAYFGTFIAPLASLLSIIFVVRSISETKKSSKESLEFERVKHNNELNSTEIKDLVEKIEKIALMTTKLYRELKVLNDSLKSYEPLKVKLARVKRVAANLSQVQPVMEELEGLIQKINDNQHNIRLIVQDIETFVQLYFYTRSGMYYFGMIRYLDLEYGAKKNIDEITNINNRIIILLRSDTIKMLKSLKEKLIESEIDDIDVHLAMQEGYDYMSGLIVQSMAE